MSVVHESGYGKCEVQIFHEKVISKSIASLEYTPKFSSGPGEKTAIYFLAISIASSGHFRFLGREWIQILTDKAWIQAVGEKLK